MCDAFRRFNKSTFRYQRRRLYWIDLTPETHKSIKSVHFSWIPFQRHRPRSCRWEMHQAHTIHRPDKFGWGGRRHGQEHTTYGTGCCRSTSGNGGSSPNQRTKRSLRAGKFGPRVGYQSPGDCSGERHLTIILWSLESIYRGHLPRCFGPKR